MMPAAIGHGAGHRDPPFVANLVRVVVGEMVQDEVGQVTELAANIDDMLGEHVPPLLERMLTAGALDAWATPILMKKGRPGLTIHALCNPEAARSLADVMLRHSTTLGVRWSSRDRTVLERRVEQVSTPFGPIGMKVGGRDGEAWHVAPEFEDVRAAADAAGVPLSEVHRAALTAWSSGD
jgi:uncharacterized protein (DUF111 family)